VGHEQDGAGNPKQEFGLPDEEENTRVICNASFLGVPYGMSVEEWRTLAQREYDSRTVEQEYKRALERNIAYIMQKAAGEYADELLACKGPSGNTLLEDITEDMRKTQTYYYDEIYAAIGHVLTSRMQELEVRGKDRPVPEGQKNWTITTADKFDDVDEIYHHTYHFTGTADEAKKALLQLVLKDRADDLGSDGESYWDSGTENMDDIKITDDGASLCAYADRRVEYAAIQTSRIEELSRDFLGREMPSFEEEWNNDGFGLMVSYQNTDGEPITARYGTIMDFVCTMESDELDIPMLDDGPVQAVFSGNGSVTVQFDDISELLDYCRDILEEREREPREEDINR
jgi:hypothetical protein